MTTRTIHLFACASLLVACGSNANGTGGGGSTGVGGGCAIDPRFTEVLQKPLSGCSGHEPPCHNGGAGNLHIDPADAAGTWAALVNADAFISSSAGKRVVPGDPDHSFLYRKLVNDLGAADGAPMPTSGLATGWTELPPEQIEIVRCWILGGAKND